MKKRTEYFTDSPIQTDITQLSNQDIHFDKNRGEVNELVLNILIKYLIKYLNVKEGNIEESRRKIEILVNESKDDDANFNPYISGQHVENIYGMSPGVDFYPLQCHGDIRKTAAIFKEIAFNDTFRKEGNFYGLDMGSGTGILTLAMAIAARRFGIGKIDCLGIELKELTASRSRNTLKQIIGGEGRILHDNLHKKGKLESLLSSMPHFWVSETVMSHTLHSTPKLDLYQDDLGLSITEKVRQNRILNSDPFVTLLKRTIELIPEFRELVEKGKIAMFPDIVNGLYKPDKDSSRMQLKTGTGDSLLLHEIGREFDNYEDLELEVNRWSVDSDNEEETLSKKVLTVRSESENDKSQLKLFK